MDVTGQFKYLIVTFFIAMSSHVGYGQEASLIWNKNKAIGVQLHLEGLTPQINVDDVKLYLKGADGDILVEKYLEDNILLLRTIIPLSKGKQYYVLINDTQIPFSVERKDNTPPEIVSFFPQGKEIPTNLLKLRIGFSQEMSHSHSKNYVQVFGNSNNENSYPFLDLENELWNADHTELTLWLDPGRIKKGLLSQKGKGDFLVDGDEITIKISNEWKDINGIPLTKEYLYEYKVRQADVSKPSLENWDVFTPKSKTIKPLVILFDEEMDNQLVLECLNINQNGNRVAGDFSIKKKGMALFFYPHYEWNTSAYTIEVQPKLEDLAGNNLNRLFDEDLLNQSTDEKSLMTVSFKPIPE